LERGTKVLKRNAKRDGRKGGKFEKRWLGPYMIEEYLGKGVYKLANVRTGRVLKKAVNICLLKVYLEPNVLHNSSSSASVGGSNSLQEQVQI